MENLSIWFAIEICLKYILFNEGKCIFNNDNFICDSSIYYLNLIKSRYLSRKFERSEAGESNDILQIIYRLILDENLLFWL